MNFLVDYNIEGQALVLLGNIAKEGWIELLGIRFVTFKENGLPIDSSDRVVWREAQANQMILLTANRSMKGFDSLEEVIREENTLASFPVITIGNGNRIDEHIYRKKCVDRIIEIVLDLENYMGTARLFIP